MSVRREELRETLDRLDAREKRLAQEYRYALHRRAYLPRQVEATRRKLIALEREAERLGVRI